MYIKLPVSICQPVLFVKYLVCGLFVACLISADSTDTAGDKVVKPPETTDQSAGSMLCFCVQFLFACC